MQVAWSRYNPSYSRRIARSVAVGYVALRSRIRVLLSVIAAATLRPLPSTPHEIHALIIPTAQ